MYFNSREFFRKTFSLKQFFLLSMGLSLLGCSAIASWADCKTDYDASITLLDSQVQQAEQKKLYDADEFETTFKKSVDKLQNGHCLPELLSLIQHIQTAQQKHPIQPAQQPKVAPIAD